MTPADFFNRILPPQLTMGTVGTAYAPANIALAKYWGKRERSFNLPVNGSLSISLGNLGTHTRITAATHDGMTLNGQQLPTDNAMYCRTFAFIDRFRRHSRQPLWVESHNTIPTAAGLASSASGFAALTLALNDFWQLHLSDTNLSAIARIGSGSAARSLWHGFVKWQAGEQPDGSDSVAAPLHSDWQMLRIALLEIDGTIKKTPSGTGMNHTTATSPLYAAWPQTAAQDLARIETAVHTQDFTALGTTAEGNALAMHATMLAARPALCYLQPQSLATLQRIWQCREDGLKIYATMDAGPNVKVLYRATDETAVRAVFPQALHINPFATAYT
ncbi:MAG: diphosphomevalonate decarboxylase [Cardiobacteriaceae bacterium]|nr:diphosphomevalonate decarboxylase [Cardiobacteriaceae bacterium]